MSSPLEFCQLIKMFMFSVAGHKQVNTFKLLKLIRFELDATGFESTRVIINFKSFQSNSFRYHCRTRNAIRWTDAKREQSKHKILHYYYNYIFVFHKFGDLIFHV